MYYSFQYIYRSNDNFNLEDSHVIPGLIHKCYLAKKNNTVFILKGTGKALRQFIYSEDIAKLIMKIIEETINLFNKNYDISRR